jgi:hypothetical protein
MHREASTRHTEEKLRHIPRLLVSCLQPNPLRAFRAKRGRLSVSGKNTTPYWPGIADIRPRPLCERVDFALKCADRRNIEPLIIDVKQVVIGIRLGSYWLPRRTKKVIQYGI